MSSRLLCVLGVVASFGLACLPAAFGRDWPTFGHDSHRSGATTETLTAPLREEWCYTPVEPPTAAWGDPAPVPIEHNLELPRVRFDDAFHVAVAGDLLYFGSSADHKLYALEAPTGVVRWEFYTGGPVRLAPTVWNDRVYVGSDDGKVYCLAASSGDLKWEFAAALRNDKVLGHGRMISLWPVRTGVLLDGGVAYFGAGLFPAEGLCLYAVDAEDGRLLWKNDSFSNGGAGMISPQGYMMASPEKLFVPSGRALPAAFSRKDGRFLFQPSFNWRQIGLFGGTYSLLAGDLLFNGTEQLVGVSEAKGQLAFTEGARKLVVSDDAVYFLTGQELVAREREASIAIRTELHKTTLQFNDQQKNVAQLRERTKKDPKLAEQLTKEEARFQGLKAKRDKQLEKLAHATRWRVPSTSTDSLVLAGTMLVAGGANRVSVFSAATGETTWSAPVNGNARGLAVAGGRLFVSTDRGSIHCFAQGKDGAKRQIKPHVSDHPYPRDGLTEFYARAAETITREAGVERGYCLLLGGTGRLALELVKRTELVVYVASRDPTEIDRARAALTRAGLYGTRVTVLGELLDELPYGDYFANLIVCEESFLSDSLSTPPEEVLRLLKPCGGVAWVGRPLDVPPERVTWPGLGAWLERLERRLEAQGESGTRIQRQDGWAKITRGPLNGAGSWTHQYADAGNTTCGDDELVRGPLGVLWFGEPGPARMPNRHVSSVSPLAAAGRMFVQGENLIMAYDSYNGLLLWERAIPGALRTGLKMECGNLAANDDSLFVATRTECLRVDAATGKTRMTYRVPQREDMQGQWGYISSVGNTLFGSRSKGRYHADSLFAFDVESGAILWQHEGKEIMHSTLCVGDGRVYFVERSVTESQRKQGLAGVPEEMRVDRKGKPIKPDVRLVVALDGATGKKKWERPLYLADCVGISKGGGDLTAMYAGGVLLLCGQPWNGHFWKEFFEGEFSRRSLIALSGADGYSLWSGRKGYRSRPLIVGDRIIAEPWAYDLRTGTDEKRLNPITGVEDRWQISRPGHHCGCIAAGPHALFFRSGYAAFYDLEGDYGTVHFGGQRTGCWINCIPANGLVLMPEASSGCVCPYPIHCTVVFNPRERHRGWGTYSTAGGVLPVRSLAVNLGAPGDRKDSSGTLWLGFPRPRSGRLVLDLALEVKMLEGGRYRRTNGDFTETPGTVAPWVSMSGAVGILQLVVPLAAEGAEAAEYTVRLYFQKTQEARPGERVVDVKLQGRTVLKDFDIARVEGSREVLVEEFRGVVGSDRLTVDFLPHAKTPTAAQVPVLSAVEVLKQKRF